MIHSLPPLGISLVRSLGEKLTERNIRDCAEKMIDCGLRDVGYEYIIIPDTWCKKRRNLADDSLVCDTEILPSKLSGIADYLHSVGLRLGVVMSLGSRSTSDRPGCFDREWQDIEYFDREGVDYIAFDITRIPAHADVETSLRRIAMAVRNATHDIYYAVYSPDDIHTQARSEGINSYCLRSFADAAPARELSPESAGYSADFCFESCGDITVCDTDLLRTQLIVAASQSSPIIIDCDVRCLTSEQLSIIANRKLIRICRDEEARPARRLSEGVYVKTLTDCEYAVALVNSTDSELVRSFSTYDFGLTWNAAYACVASDIFTNNTETFTDAIDACLPARHASMYLVKLTER